MDVMEYLESSQDTDQLKIAENYLVNMSEQEFKWFCETNPAKDMSVITNGIDMKLALEWRKAGIKSVPIKVNGVDYELDVNGWINSRGPGEYIALDGGDALRDVADRMRNAVAIKARRLAMDRHREISPEKVEAVNQLKESMERKLSGRGQGRYVSLNKSSTRQEAGSRRSEGRRRKAAVGIEV